MNSSLFPIIAMEEWRVEFKWDADTWGPWSSHSSEQLAWEHLDRCVANCADGPGIELRIMHIVVKATEVKR